MKLFLLIFAYVILLVHNCVPHHHHQTTNDENHQYNIIDNSNSNSHNHSQHKDHNHQNDKDEQEHENPYSHFIHALDFSDFFSNQTDFFSAKKYFPNQDLFVEQTLFSDYFAQNVLLIFDLVEDIFFDPHCKHYGLRAPPIC